MCAYVNGQLVEKFLNGAQDKSITAFDGDKKSDTFSYKRVYCIVVTYSSGSSCYTCSTAGLYYVSEKINSSILCSLLITSKLHFRMALQLISLRSWLFRELFSHTYFDTSFFETEVRTFPCVFVSFIIFYNFFWIYCLQFDIFSGSPGSSDDAKTLVVGIPYASKGCERVSWINILPGLDEYNIQNTIFVHHHRNREHYDRHRRVQCYDYCL